MESTNYVQKIGKKGVTLWPDYITMLKKSNEEITISKSPRKIAIFSGFAAWRMFGWLLLQL